MAGFQKAKREKIWLKILLGGASGSGKSYSALRLATGIAKKGKGKVAAIDTEAGRIRYYANEFDFDDLQLDEPYTPEKYINAIDEAIGSFKFNVSYTISGNTLTFTFEADGCPSFLTGASSSKSFDLTYTPLLGATYNIVQ